MIKTTVTGLASNNYDVYAFFWSDKDEQWELQGGLNSNSMTAFEKLGAQHVSVGELNGATTVDAGNGEHYLYKVYLGRTKVTDGTLAVYVNDGIGYLGGRTWYDGIGYSVAPAITPSMTVIPDQTLPSNTASSPLSITLSDADTPTSSLTLTGSAANAALIPPGNIAFSGSAASRSVIITPASGASGTTSVTLVVGDGTTTSSRTFAVTILDPSQTWRWQNFGADWNSPEIAGETADPDGDCVPNLLERAFAGNPNLREHNLMPSIDPAAPLLSIIYRKAKAATDLVFSVPESADLRAGSWSPASGTNTKIGDDGVVETFRFTALADHAPRKFLRVQVTKN